MCYIQGCTCTEGEGAALGVHSRPKVAPSCTSDLDDLVRPRHALRGGVALRTASLCSSTLSDEGNVPRAQLLLGIPQCFGSSTWCGCTAAAACKLNLGCKQYTAGELKRGARAQKIQHAQLTPGCVSMRVGGANLWPRMQQRRD